MPTYEYECQRCKKRSEVFQSITADPLKKCVGCGGELSRLIGVGGGIIFKGSGFYATDYRSEQYKKRAGEDKEPGAEKPAEKKDAKSGEKPAKSEKKGEKES